MYLDGASPAHLPARATVPRPAIHQTSTIQGENRGYRDECTSRGSGMHIVEVRRDIGDAAEPMGRVRNWLGEHRITPQLFHLHQTVFRPGVCGGH